MFRKSYHVAVLALPMLAMAALLPLAASQPALAESQSASAYEVVEAATERVMAVVREAQEYVDKDADRYYAELQAVLDDVVDFGGFSRSVMGPYASGKRYKSLNPEGRQQLRKQVSTFTDVMRSSLVRTYGKGLIAFGGSRTEVQRPDKETENPKKMSIVQLIHNKADEPYVIRYQMRRDKEGRWKLRNLIVESVNLGQIYRNQFEAAAKDRNGDLDAVIANWSSQESQ